MSKFDDNGPYTRVYERDRTRGLTVDRVRQILLAKLLVGYVILL